MIGSKLVTKTIQAYSGNYTKGRSKFSKISEITIHHCAGVTSIESLGSQWQVKTRRGSSHYGVSHNAIGQYVSEDDIAWTNSLWESNCRAVTIETSNSTMGPKWEVADDTFDTLCKLVSDIAKRNHLGTLIPGKNLTWHNMYTATICPGPYLLGKMQELADRANQMNNAVAEDSNILKNVLYRVQVGAFNSIDNAKSMQNQLKSKGFDTYIVKSGNYNRVQIGAFSKEENAKNLLVQLKNKGFSGFITSDESTSVGPQTKTVEEVAKEVLQGLWGNGEERKTKLTSNGYNYAEVQKKVNELM